MKKKIKAWAIIDVANGKILQYDRVFQGLFNIHPTKQKAINSLNAREYGAKIVRCEITYEK